MPHIPVHYCELHEDPGGLAKLPPHAPVGVRIRRVLRKLLAPNPNSAICKRNYRNRSQVNAERRRHAQNKYVFIIHPYSDLEFYRELMFMLIASWEILSAPVNASFGYSWRKRDDYQDDQFSFFTKFVAFGLELLWIISCFFAAYKERSTKLIQLDHCKIIKRYLLTYFIIDLMVMIPPLRISSDSHSFTFEDYIYWINMAIIFRFDTAITFRKRMLADLGMSDNLITFLMLVFKSFYIIHIIACMFYILPLLFRSESDKLWLVKTSLDPQNSRVMMKAYFPCMSMIQTHFWGLGESQMRVEDMLENAILIITMIIGRLWSLYFLAIMLRLFTISSLSESKYEEYLMELRTFICQKQIPRELEDRLLEYYHFKYQHHYFNEKAIFNAMSHFLKQELILFGARNVINKVKIFKVLPRSMVGSIIAKCKVMVFLNHDVVINVDDPLDTIYFISCGTLAVLNSRGVELTHMSDGQEIGIKGAITLSDVKFSFQYVAIETTELYAISLKDFRSIICNKDDILKYFAKKVEQASDEMTKIETLACAQGTDLLSELHRGKILERPRIRTRYFDR